MVRIPLRRQLRLLQAWAVLSLCVSMFLAVTAFTQATASARIDELTVHRLNVVDADGTLRLVVSNKDRMHPGIVDGVTINRPRPVAGLLFFNDEGDEVGGLTYTGTAANGRRATAGLMFDQLKQDQTIGITYTEGDGRRSAGLQVWDRGDEPLSDLIRALNAANALPEGPERTAAVQAARAKAPKGPLRLFAGKHSDGIASVALADAQGRPRLVLKVNAEGAASIEFLDAAGKAVQTLKP